MKRKELDIIIKQGEHYELARCKSITRYKIRFLTGDYIDAKSFIDADHDILIPLPLARHHNSAQRTALKLIRNGGTGFSNDHLVWLEDIKQPTSIIWQRSN